MAHSVKCLPNKHGVLSLSLYRIYVKKKKPGKVPYAWNLRIGESELAEAC